MAYTHYDLHREVWTLRLRVQRECPRRVQRSWVVGGSSPRPGLAKRFGTCLQLLWSNGGAVEPLISTIDRIW